MPIEISELIGQIVSVRYDVKGVLAEFVLHFDDVSTQSVFPGELETIRKVIDLLVFVQIVVDILLVGLTWPKDIPVVWLGLLEAIDLEDGAQKLGFGSDELEKHIGRAIVHVRVEDGPLLEIYCALAISNQLYQIKTCQTWFSRGTYYRGILQSLEINEFCLEIVLNILLLLLWALARILLHIWQDCIHMALNLRVALAWVLTIAIRILSSTSDGLPAVAGRIVALHELYFDSFFFPVTVLKQEIEHASESFLFYFVILFLFFNEVIITIVYLPTTQWPLKIGTCCLAPNTDQPTSHSSTRSKPTSWSRSRNGLTILRVHQPSISTTYSTDHTASHTHAPSSIITDPSSWPRCTRTATLSMALTTCQASWIAISWPRCKLDIDPSPSTQFVLLNSLVLPDQVLINRLLFPKK